MTLDLAPRTNAGMPNASCCPRCTKLELRHRDDAHSEIADTHADYPVFGPCEVSSYDLAKSVTFDLTSGQPAGSAGAEIDTATRSCQAILRGKT